MKYLSSVILGFLCLGLGVCLFVNKSNNDAQHEKDAEAISGASNLLSSCQTEVIAFKGEASTLSNRLQTSQSTSLTFSNELIEARSVLASTKEGLDRQITDLNRQIARQTTQLETEHLASSQRLAELTQQLAELTNQIASTQATLLQVNRDYVLLDHENAKEDYFEDRLGFPCFAGN